MAVKGLARAIDHFAKDLDALPEDAFDRCFGGKARTVADIVHEVNLVNDDVVRSLRGEPMMDWPEGWVTAPADQRTKATVTEAFARSSQQALDLANSLTEADMARPIKTEHGETHAFERVRFMATHVMYHSAQLNYIQTLLGDDGWHW